MKNRKLSQNQNVTITINTLRAHANEMLNVANHLEATERFIGAGITRAIHSGTSPGKRGLSLVGRRKIAKSNKARAAKRKELAVVGKTA